MPLCLPARLGKIFYYPKCSFFVLIMCYKLYQDFFIKNRFLYAMANIRQNTIVNPDKRRGRGSRSNVSGRFEPVSRSEFDDGWETLADAPAFKTEVQEEQAKTVLTRNDSPDIPFSQSLNIYRGCEHGCPYCFARPTHAYLGLSPGLDFESKLFVKTNAVTCLIDEISKKSYKVQSLAMGTNTDPYQPIERQYKLTREVLELCLETGHPVGLVTKSALVLRDLDVLQGLAEYNLVRVGISVTSLDRYVSRSMEPRASTPAKRIAAIEALGGAGVPVIAMLAPVIPGINDHEIENILDRVKDAGAVSAAYVLLRLPLELKELFHEWLETDFPDRAKKVYSIMKTMRGGKLYDSQWGERMRGNGPYADMIASRFGIAVKKLQLNMELPELRTDLFKPPKRKGDQLELF